MYKTQYQLYCCILLFVGITACQSPQQEKTSVASKKSDWEKLGPGGGGATFIPTFSFQNPEKFLLRCDMTGSYVTGNGGESYQQINFANGASSYAYDPGDSNTLYIGSSMLNRSVDGGKTWETIFPQKNEIKKEVYMGDHANYYIEVSDGSLYEKGGISNIRVDPARVGALYFSVHNFFFYSMDGGKTWKKQALNSAIDFIYADMDKAKDAIFIFTATGVSIFHPSLQKITQQPLPAAMSPAFSFTGGINAQKNKSVFYALHMHSQDMPNGEPGPGEVWMSEDMGATWKRIVNTVITNSNATISPSYSMIRCAEYDADNAYLVCNGYAEKINDSTKHWYGALKTSDGGNNWSWVWKGGGGSGQYGVKDGISVANLRDAWVDKAFGGEYIRLIDVGVSPTNGNIAIVTDWYRAMKTMDGGLHWKEIYSQPQADGSFTSRGTDVTTTYSVHFDPFDSSHIAVSYTDIGFHHSYNNGKSWFRSTTGVPVEWINTCYDVIFDPAVKGKVWSAWSGMHDIPRGKMTRNPNWKQYAKGGICMSNDGGKNWQPVDTSTSFNAPVTSIVMDPLSKPGNRILYAAVYSKGVYKSIDDGKTWQLMNNGIGENTAAFELTLTGNGSLFLTVSPVPAHKDGKKGRAYYSGAAYRSTDGAVTWKKLTVTDSALFPNGIDYDKENPDHLYLTCWAALDLSDLVGGAVARETGGNEVLNMPGGIFESKDAGNTWVNIFDSTKYVYNVTVDPYHKGRIYCNTFNRAAYRSDDYGKTWKKIQGYDFHWGHRIIVDPLNHEKVYITTFGSSVWHGVPQVE